MFSDNDLLKSAVQYKSIDCAIVDECPEKYKLSILMKYDDDFEYIGEARGLWVLLKDLQNHRIYKSSMKRYIREMDSVEICAEYYKDGDRFTNIFDNIRKHMFDIKYKIAFSPKYGQHNFAIAIYIEP